MSEGGSGGIASAGISRVLVPAITAIVNAGEAGLTFGRGVVDASRGYVLRAVDENLSEAEKLEQFVFTRPAIAKTEFGVAAEPLMGELEEVLQFVLPQTSLLPEPFQTLADLLLHPTYVPGEACRAPTPLLRDLLDVALGRITGGLDAIFTQAKGSVLDFLLPAFGKAEELDQAVQAILADPVTAALNLVLGQQGPIECVVDARLGVGIDVIGTQIKRLEGALAEVLP